MEVEWFENNLKKFKKSIDFHIFYLYNTYMKQITKGGKKVDIKTENFLQIRNVDREKKRKAMFILQTQGKNLSQAVREMIDGYAAEFDKKISK